MGAVAFSPDGCHLAAAGSDENIRVYTMPDGTTGRDIPRDHRGGYRTRVHRRRTNSRGRLRYRNPHSYLMDRTPDYPHDPRPLRPGDRSRVVCLAGKPLLPEVVMAVSVSGVSRRLHYSQGKRWRILPGLPASNVPPRRAKTGSSGDFSGLYLWVRFSSEIELYPELTGPVPLTSRSRGE